MVTQRWKHYTYVSVALWCMEQPVLPTNKKVGIKSRVSLAGIKSRLRSRILLVTDMRNGVSCAGFLMKDGSLILTEIGILLIEGFHPH